MFSRPRETHSRRNAATVLAIEMHSTLCSEDDIDRENLTTRVFQSHTSDLEDIVHFYSYKWQTIALRDDTT
jgi:hypothetical protein